MPNWVPITVDELKTAGHGDIIDRAQVLATGSVDPIVETTANAIARVRAAVRAGNRLDVDGTKVPLSLKDLTMRLIVFALMARIGMPLSDDQSKQAGRDESRLERLLDRKLQVEPADNPDTVAGPVNPGMWNSERKIIPRTHPVPPPATQFPPGGYANPDAPQDSDE